ncbi:MAG TPA: DNA gyrase inhibitor YacG [Steroidobacteraceae bacterium]|nr:DNA gyrase inhibitor YacG [Steroidobacteraceae bacterium]
MSMATIVKCPTCRRPVEWSAASTYRPFCSERCRLVDLGAWFNEQHKIPDESPAAADESPPNSAEDS